MGDNAKGETIPEDNVEGEADVTDFDEDYGVGIMRQGDKWYLADGAREQVAGPFMNKKTAPEPLAAYCGYDIGKRREENAMTSNIAWKEIDRLADAMVLKSGEHLSHARRVAKFLETPQGRALCERGYSAHGRTSTACVLLRRRSP